MTPRDALAKAEAGAAIGGECGHAEAMRLHFDGDLSAAAHRWDAVAADDPFDILAVKWAHLSHFGIGNHGPMRDAARNVLPAYDTDHEWYPLILSMAAFGHEEAGEYEQAESLAREAAERAPDDLWAVHALTHVLEMQGRATEGVAWIEANADRLPVNVGFARPPVVARRTVSHAA